MTISYADFIYVTQGGELPEIGSHLDDVLVRIGNNCGAAYADMGVSETNALRGAFL